MEDLNDGLQYQLLSYIFASFQQLVDKALVIKNKHRQNGGQEEEIPGATARE